MTELTVSRIPSANRYIRHWRGGHYKSELVREFEEQVMEQLPAFLNDATDGTRLRIIFILSRNNRDLDNLPKAFIDCLERKYGFNDKKITELHLEKRIEKGGCEKILFEFREGA